MKSATDGQRVELRAVVAESGIQTTSKTGTFKRTILLADSSGCIELTLLCDGAVSSANLVRGDTILATNAKFNTWNGKSSLLMFSTPLLIEDTVLSLWWKTTGTHTESMSIKGIHELADQTKVQNIIGLVISTENASSTKSGGIKRKFSLADESTSTPIEVCFVGSLAAHQPQYNVGCVVRVPSAKVSIWKGARSLLTFEPPAPVTEVDTTVQDLYNWIRTGGADIHQPLSIEQLRMTNDDTIVDLRPMTVTRISERTVTTSGNMWKRFIHIHDESATGDDSVCICCIGAAADATLNIGDIIDIKRAKACNLQGRRGAIIFDAPTRLANHVHEAAQYTPREISNKQGVSDIQESTATTLSQVMTMVDGTHVELSVAEVLNEDCIADVTGTNMKVQFLHQPPQSRFVRIIHAKVANSKLAVYEYSPLLDQDHASQWSFGKNNHEHNPPSEEPQWPF